MAGGGEGRSLEQTPTWAVAVVCFCLVLISIFIEHIIHRVGKLLERKNKRALFEALEKIKSELMLLGFISLLLTVGQGPISNICIQESVANTWHPCSKQDEASESDDKDTPSEEETDSEDSTHRRLLSIGLRRVLAAAATDKCQAKGKVSFVSNEGIHQLHIFIFVLAVSHVCYCIVTVALGRLKIKRWKAWEMETRTVEYQFTHDPERFRFTRDTSFGRRHLNSWSKSTVLLWIVSFFRQFFQSVPKVDYLTLRHGFITAHLAPQTAARFDFQKYINRSLEEDIKAVVGISPVLWFLAVLFILSNTHGWYAYIWLPSVPLIVILLVGTKLQVIITRMGLRIQDRGDIVKGIPVVEPGDSLFWFNQPRLILYLINFVLFENAFQLAFFAWTWYEFGLTSCYHDEVEDIVVRITMGVVIQLLCSYVTLPLYALVTQMGSNMKPTIFNENVARAMKTWHHTTRKQIKHNGHSASVTPMSSRPTTPTHDTSPIHLLQFYHSEVDSAPSTPRRSNVENDHWESQESLASHMNQMGEGSSSHQHWPSGQGEEELFDLSLTDLPPIHGDIRTQHEIDVPSKDRHEIRSTSKDFSFAKRI